MHNLLGQKSKYANENVRVSVHANERASERSKINNFVPHSTRAHTKCEQKSYFKEQETLKCLIW